MPVNKPISGIKFIDSLKGWACTSITTLGDTSFIINTTNGGVNWNIQYVAPEYFLSMLLVLLTKAVMVEATAKDVLKTTNSGVNWNR